MENHVFFGASAPYKNRIERFKEIIDKSKRIVFLTGAGISTASGIPDFRSKNGLYNEHDQKYSAYQPEYLLSRECLLNNPEVFYSYLRDKFAPNDNIRPNIAHTFMADLESQGKVSAIITQNIEGLHEMAGSEKVYNCHGTMSACRCDACSKKYPGNIIFTEKEPVPRCDCGLPNNFIRPDIVLYGENLPTNIVDAGLEKIMQADCLIIAGTSLQVLPVSAFPNCFEGEYMVVVNRDPTPFDNYADVVFHEDMSQVWKEMQALQKEEQEVETQTR